MIERLSGHVNFTSCRLMFLASVVTIGKGQEDDFTCPDDFPGYYPHTYRLEGWGKCNEYTAVKFTTVS